MQIKKNTISLLLFLFLFGRLLSQSVGGIASGGATYCDTINSGFVSITGYNGNVVNWIESTDGGTTWINNTNTFTSQSYFNLKQSTCYRAIVKDGAFPPDTSTIVCVTIYIPTQGGIVSGGGSFCNSAASGTLNLTGNIGNVLNWQYSTNGGSTWSVITNTNTSLSYSTITQNTMYAAVVQNSSFCKIDTSSAAVFNIDPLTVSGTISLGGNDTVCYGINSNTLALSGNVGLINAWIYSEDNGVTWNYTVNNTTMYSYSGLIQTTSYAVIVQSGVCPTMTATPVKITVYAPNPVDAGPDVSINQGESTALNGTGLGSPAWTPTLGLLDPVSYTTTATPDITTSYVLTVTDVYSCVNYDTVLVTVIPLVFEGEISSVFTPNGDGINDTWYIENISGYPDNEVQVYNIYGNEVFSKKKYTGDWTGTYNGSPLPDGTYYYILKVNQTQKPIKGSIDILRNK